MNKAQTKVFVGISGGVDSSIAAALLKEQGYDVTGVFIKVWQPPFLECSIKDDRRDAMRVCAQLGIPFRECDAEEAYKTRVIDYMMSEYKRGRTPNPDVMCNKYVKFGVFYDWAVEQGADMVATGHYAQTHNGILFKSISEAKDQSYFLWAIGPDKLRNTLFPIGHLHKDEVRALAEKYILFTAHKKDSQGLCFLGKLDVKDFLKKFIESKKGNVINEKGEIIGTHEGAYFFTLGERHGFTITQTSHQSKPLYVIAKDIEANAITVAEKEYMTMSGRQQLSLEHVVMYNALILEQSPSLLTLVYRYHGTAHTISDIRITEDGINITCNDVLIDCASGQSVVIYHNTELVAGGIVV